MFEGLLIFLTGENLLTGAELDPELVVECSSLMTSSASQQDQFIFRFMRIILAIEIVKTCELKYILYRDVASS